MLELVGVSKRYGRAAALSETDLTVKGGETTVLLGPSGCGKSTLLRLMIGLIRPDSGVVRVLGEPLTPESQLGLRRRMGYVIQEGGLFPHLTAADNAALMARHIGMEKSKIGARLDELRDLVKLPRDLFNRYPAELSGGQRQRVSLVRALMLDPDVLLLDEPLGALDPIIRSDLQADLRGIFEALKKTVVIVTHDIGEAAFFGGTAVLLNGGKIVQRGAFVDLVRSPADPFVTRFINAQRLPVEALRGEQA
jgi:osmoprotectant transport system ATP-binding protein